MCQVGPYIAEVYTLFSPPYQAVLLGVWELDLRKLSVTLSVGYHLIIIVDYLTVQPNGGQ